MQFIDNHVAGRDNDPDMNEWLIVLVILYIVFYVLIHFK